MNQTIYEKLKRVARAGTLITYADVAELVGLDMENADRNEMSNLLDEISSHEHHQGRPLLSVVVIRRDLGRTWNRASLNWRGSSGCSTAVMKLPR